MGDKKSTKTHTRTAVPDSGNIVGADPHKRTLTASVLDERGGLLGTETFRVSGDGHRAMEAWALSFGSITRWGIEGAGGLGRHTAMYLIGQGHDVRDVSPTRTAEQSRRRREGKTDALDSVRIARETQADQAMPVAFKRAGGDAGPDETHELMSLWHKGRRSILKSRQHLLKRGREPPRRAPEALRSVLPDTAEVRPPAPRARRTRRAQLGPGYDPAASAARPSPAAVAELDAQDREAARALKALAEQAGSTLRDLCGIAERIEAEFLVETGDPRRFTGRGRLRTLQRHRPPACLLCRR